MSNHLVIELIATEQTLRECATAEDLTFVEQFASESRRRESLAWRAIVRRELGAEVQISYDEYGAPEVDKPNLYISISHSRDMIAVLFGDRPCAVDIEHTKRDFCKVASRYLSDAEQLLAEQNSLYAEMWCAKEALYKYYRKGGLNIVKDVVLSGYYSDRGEFEASILNGKPIVVSIKRVEEFVVAVID